MILAWLIVWLAKGAPDVHTWDAWAISLVIVAWLDFVAVLVPRSTR